MGPGRGRFCARHLRPAPCHAGDHAAAAGTCAADYVGNSNRNRAQQAADARTADDDRRTVELYTAYLDSQSERNWYSSVVLRERASTHEWLQQYDHVEADFAAALKASLNWPAIYAERDAFSRGASEGVQHLTFKPKEYAV